MTNVGVFASAYRLAALAILSLALTVSGEAGAKNDPTALPTESTGSSVLRGNLVIIGSDTMARLVTDWSEYFQTQHRQVSVEIQALGSAAAPIALAEGVATVGAMSRSMSAEELRYYKQRRGYLPTGVPVGEDELVVIVHPDNPLDYLTIKELDAIFSSTLNCGASEAITAWQQISRLAGTSVSSLPVEPLSRTAISGSNGFFRAEALCEGDFSPRVVEELGFAAIADRIAAIPGSIAYVGARFVTDRVKRIGLQRHRLGAVSSLDSLGAYRLQRYLWLYFNKQPEKPLSAIECEFLRSAFSETGQRTLTSLGFTPFSRHGSQSSSGGERDLDECR